jgi:flagellar secretion chaperone FliS
MTNARDGYLENEVLSASPARLHLLLVEGAVRSIEQTRQHWRSGHNELACDTLIRAQEIVTEMMGGLNRDVHPQLTDRMAAVYLFVFRTLVQAGVKHSETQLDEALRILAIERDTWRMVCEKLKAEASDAAPPHAGPSLPPHFGVSSDAEPSGFSIDA